MTGLFGRRVAPPFAERSLWTQFPAELRAWPGSIYPRVPDTGRMRTRRRPRGTGEKYDDSTRGPEAESIQARQTNDHANSDWRTQ